MPAMFIDRQATLRVERQAVGAGLAELADIRAVIATLVPEHAQHALARIAIDRVVVGIAEQQGPFLWQPDRTFRELESFGNLEELRVRRDDRVDARIIALDAHVDFMGLDRNRYFRAGTELEARLVDEDIIGRGIRDRAVHPEDRQLDALTGSDVPAHEQPVGGIPAGDDRAAHLTEGAADLSVHPHFRVVVEPRLEPQIRTGWVEVANPFRNRDGDPIPVERHPACPAARRQRIGWYLQPCRVVEFCAARMRLDVVGRNDSPRWLPLRIRCPEPRVDDASIGIAP